MRHIVSDCPEVVGPWVAERSGAPYSPGVSTTIGLVDDQGVIIAGAMYDGYYQGGSVRMHFAGGEGRLWARKENIRHVFAYPFEQLKVNKIIGLVREDNHQARKFDEHLGFILETRIKNACAGGDILVYTMTKDQCRYL